MSWTEGFLENVWKALGDSRRQKRQQQAWYGRIREENVTREWKLTGLKTKERKKQKRENFSWRVVYRGPKLAKLERRRKRKHCT